jgi:formate hydrogenlyase subunit 3/multisubunit Na+/H+ antiporter MnhD subunit
MMWMTVLRPIVVLIGIVSLTSAAVLASVLPRQNAAANVLMILVLLLIAVELVIGVGAILFGVWRPLKHWLAPRPTDR